jgi:hypothetical protein
MMSHHRKSKIDFRLILYVVKSNLLRKVIYMMLKHIFALQKHIKLNSFLTV